MIEWLLSTEKTITTKCNSKEEKTSYKELLSNDIKNAVAINNLIKTIQYYGWNAQELCSCDFKYPLPAIVFRKMMFQKTLRNLDLTGSYLGWMSFYGSDLTGCNFTLSEITGCDFSSSILRDTIWIETKIGEAGALMNGSDLSDAVFGHISLNNRTVLDNCKLKNSIINSPILIGTSSIGMIVNNLTADNGFFQNLLCDDSTFENSIIHQGLISRSDEYGYRISLGSGVLKENEPIECRFRLVKGSAVLHDSKEQRKVLITSSDLELNDRIRQFKETKKLEKITVSNVVCSRTNVETDWEYRPGYEISFEITESDGAYVLTVNLKDVGKLTDGITAYFDLIPIIENGVVKDGSDFEGSQFNNTRIWNSKVDGANMRSLDVRDCSFFGSDFFNTSFDGTRFEKIDMSNSVTVRGHYVECSFNTAKIEDADIENNNFIRCSIKDVIISDSVIDSCLIQASQIKTLNAINCIFIDTTVEDTEYTGTLYFEKCKFIGNFENILNWDNVVLNDCIMNGRLVSKNL